ncbi:hypothetical protein DD238_008234 [Peronospora effusa]|uniref:Prolyl 4-hydroxylase alpha subunit domain-containing protein n=1 Tax=Peronospora effusa TaxID=542832 RepID=A0A3M6V7J7_9STRA|nr:hypothetical protein DD238_008234 [Peronospora effusa]
MQLVRYAAGEFYRQHFDTFHSRKVLPKGADSFEFEDYVVWTKWAAEKLRGLDQSSVPEKFREGGPLFPNADDPIVFPNALLEAFHEYMNTSNRFNALFDTKYDEWIRLNLDNGTENMMEALMETDQRPLYLPSIVKTWEEKLGLGELRYTFPKHDTNSVSHFFYWVRWAKERVSFLGDKVPADARPNGSLYPRFTLRYKLPEYVQHFHPQRYVTLFLYLNNQTKVGGETVFPFSLDRYSDEEIVRDGMDECSSGLALPPLGLHASLFYVQTPDGIPDPMSRHGGCPPQEGVKWGANSFMWDSDSDEGANFWSTNFLGDKVPADARPNGSLYPRFTVKFQDMLTGFILDDYTPGFIIRMTNSEWYDWMVFNRGRNHVLLKMMQVWPQFAELAIRTWEARVGNVPELRYKLPEYVQHFHPQRYVTLFLYLNNQTKVGGETVFPFSLDRYSDEEIVRDGMDECSSGLALPPLGLHASLFYVQTPDGIPDPMSRHGGCPPQEGVKWGANSFMWDSDSEEGANFWSTN